jgi:hypothetical protein
MSLTAGTTLQSDKFIIEETLHESDFGVTYRACHVLMQRPVILYTFNEALRQRPDFDHLRQKFLNTVLLGSDELPESLPLMDCFEENGMPFVVMAYRAEQWASPEQASAQPFAKLDSWLAISPETDAALAQATSPASDSPQSDLTPYSDLMSDLMTVADAPAVTDAPTSNPTSNPTPNTQTSETAPTLVVSPIAHPIAQPSTQPVSQPPHLQVASKGSNGKANVKVLVADPPAKPKTWLPLAVMMTALITSFGGIGLGLAMRFEPTSQGGDQAPGLGTGWFGSDQNFPAKEEWPITETPDLFPPTPTLEQPFYRSTPSDANGLAETPIPDWQPSTEYVPPSAPPVYRSAPPAYEPPPTIAAPAPEPEPPEPIAPPAAAEPAPIEEPPPVVLPDPVTPETADPLPPEPAAPSKNTPGEAPTVFNQ